MIFAISDMHNLLCIGLSSTKKIWAQSVKGFLQSVKGFLHCMFAKHTLPCSNVHYFSKFSLFSCSFQSPTAETPAWILMLKSQTTRFCARKCSSGL